MRNGRLLRMVVTLLVCLLAGSFILAAGPPPGPPPPPPPPEPTPPEPVYPCILVVPLPPELDGLRAARALDDPPLIGLWTKARPLYESGPFKIFISLEFQGINALFKFGQLQKGAYIGVMDALVPFRFEYKGGDRCPPPPVGAARSFDDGSYLLWMANAPALGIKWRAP